MSEVVAVVLPAAYVVLAVLAVRAVVATHRAAHRGARGSERSVVITDRVRERP